MLGATDSGPLMAWKRPGLEASLAKYQTVADIYMRVCHDIVQPSSTVMARGLMLEPTSRKLYRDTVGECSEPPGVVTHPALPWVCASPDAYAGDDGLVEFKSTTVFARNRWGEPGTDKVPDSYATQLQWQLAVTNRKWAHLLVVFGRDWKDEHGGPQFSIEETAIYQCERNDELCAALMQFGEELWRVHIGPRVPPLVESRHNKRHWKRIQGGANVANG